MAFYNRDQQMPPTQTWDAARPSSFTADPSAPSYMPIPKRPPPTSPPEKWLETAKTANLIVSANNSTYVPAGDVRNQMNEHLSAHRAEIERNQKLLQEISRKERDCWTFFKPEDPRVALVRDKAHTLYTTVEEYAADTTSSASEHNIKFHHPTLAEPFVPPARAPPVNQESPEDEGSDEDRSRRASVSSVAGDWGSVRHEQGPFRVMNPGSTVLSTSSRARTDSMSTGRSSVATAGYPPVIRDETHSRQHLIPPAVTPPVAPPTAHTHNSHYGAPPSLASSAGQSYHTARSHAESATSYNTALSHQPSNPRQIASSGPSTIRAPAVAHHAGHVRQSSGGQSHSSLGRAPTYKSETPTYSSRGNPIPPYLVQDPDHTVAEGSNMDLRYQAAMTNAQQRAAAFQAAASSSRPRRR